MPDTPLYLVEIRYNVRIPVRDGLELSANLFMPVPRKPDEKFPALLEMIPYRKDDWRYIADHQRMTYFAQRGYMGCRLDIRGTGSSPGLALDEYTRAETQDGYDAVEWLAAQPWCNGNVGMWGISYGGFTAIQVATLQPPHLKAIVPMYATDDRYTDDVHYLGGCLTASEFALLLAMARQPGRVFTRAQLLDAIHGVAFESYERAIDAHVKNIRRKIEPDPRAPRYLLTVYGVGYRLTDV